MKNNLGQIKAIGGGGFGRRTESDWFVMAALASNNIKRPVKLIWSREQDMMFDFHRTPTYQVIEGGEEFGKFLKLLIIIRITYQLLLSLIHI